MAEAISMHQRAAVLAAHPSAREERRGLTFVAIMARTRDPSGILRDALLGSGKTAAEAWADAARDTDETDA